MDLCTNQAYKAFRCKHAKTPETPQRRWRVEEFWELKAWQPLGAGALRGLSRRFWARKNENGPGSPPPGLEKVPGRRLVPSGSSAHVYGQRRSHQFSLGFRVFFGFRVCISVSAQWVHFWS